MERYGNTTGQQTTLPFYLNYSPAPALTTQDQNICITRVHGVSKWNLDPWQGMVPWGSFSRIFYSCYSHRQHRHDSWSRWILISRFNFGISVSYDKFAPQITTTTSDFNINNDPITKGGRLPPPSVYSSVPYCSYTVPNIVNTVSILIPLPLSLY